MQIGYVMVESDCIRAIKCVFDQTNLHLNTLQLRDFVCTCLYVSLQNATWVHTSHARLADAFSDRVIVTDMTTASTIVMSGRVVSDEWSCGEWWLDSCFCLLTVKRASSYNVLFRILLIARHCVIRVLLVECDTGFWYCAEKRLCMPDEWRCDGYRDCDDPGDENVANCSKC